MLSMGIPFIGGWLFLALTKPLNLDEAYFFYIGRFIAGKVTQVAYFQFEE